MKIKNKISILLATIISISGCSIDEDEIKKPLGEKKL